MRAPKCSYISGACGESLFGNMVVTALSQPSLNFSLSLASLSPSISRTLKIFHPFFFDALTPNQLSLLFPIMCPLRFLLVFFSAVLAGYFAWKTVNSSPDDDDSPIESNDEKQGLCFKKMEKGLWVFVDMASGKYLWRNLNLMSEKTI
ncbi:uncharacterized protein LOC108843948 isoform X2 [Raphanus sativus]|uniref:Uncharacterized protein LOC108843948 isoform X2 n=1 Tax=Raphanus sativus TaxID=3726 RepID=A0A9W3CLZ4_RAPSA|nr:uncharacterized protein LOC108843948 isoform X2 [Raphanus sativus]